VPVGQTKGLSAAAALVVAAGACAGFASGCGSSAPSTSTKSDCLEATTVDRFHQLEVVDDQLLAAHSNNARGQPWSFAAQVELLRGSVDASTFLGAWVAGWTKMQTVGQLALPAREKTNAALICPWLHRTAANACNDDCSTCAAQVFDPAQAPFRLIAIANREDLGLTQPWTPLGELRLVYGLVDGAGDDASAAAESFTVAFEYGVPASSGPLQAYAKQWLALDAQSSSYDDDLMATVASVAGSAANIAQVRVNELVLDWTWQFREFHLTNNALSLVVTRNNPRTDLDDSAALDSYLESVRPDILAGKMDLPSTYLGPGGGVVQWVLPEADSVLRKSFAQQTCSGCHGSDQKAVDLNFQISPLQSGTAKLSAFLNDTTGGTDDELARRSTVMSQAACGVLD
jgi:hypothetical protein